MRVAVVHHWFVTRGGGERVAECIAALFPGAEIFTLIADPVGIPETLAGRPLHTSFLNKLPWAHSHHRHSFPFFPYATEWLDLRGFDLVLSSDSGPVKGVLLDPAAVHICYCHSPMRYLWDNYEEYRAAMNPLTRFAFALTAGRVRRWDAAAAQRVSHFLANSAYVAGRVERHYGRRATVLHPPIDAQRAQATAGERPGDSYLCAGRLVAYKRTELLVEACMLLGRSLRIAGTGPETQRLKAMAGGNPSIVFLGALSDEDLWREYARCRALLFAADEDFGMVALEAQACGRPVIAYGVGGSRETVRGEDEVHPTGLFFAEQTVEAVAQAIQRWEQERESSFHPGDARAWASRFSLPRFLEQYRAFVLEHVPAAASEMRSVEEALELLAPGGSPTDRDPAPGEETPVPSDELQEDEGAEWEALQ